MQYSIIMNEKNFRTKSTKQEADVIEFYDNYANTWDDRFLNSYSDEIFLNNRWDSFTNIIKENRIFADIAIELGVGTGVYIERCSKLFGKIIAVDGSEHMLGNLSKKLIQLKIENVETYKSNVLSLSNISDSSIDLVYFFGLIEHIVDIDGFVKELSRILKTDGCIIGITPNRASPWYSIRNLFRGTGKHCSTDTYYHLTELKQIFNTIHLEFTVALYWGAIPAGLNNKFLVKALSFAEKILLKFNLSFLLGGITFLVRKTNQRVYQ
jgi:ubiquinone/menaquinone biosynthesis C-methylase UbiE